MMMRVSGMTIRMRSAIFSSSSYWPVHLRK